MCASPAPLVSTGAPRSTASTGAPHSTVSAQAGRGTWRVLVYPLKLAPPWSLAGCWGTHTPPGRAPLVPHHARETPVAHGPGIRGEVHPPGYTPDYNFSDATMWLGGAIFFPAEPLLLG